MNILKFTERYFENDSNVFLKKFSALLSLFVLCKHLYIFISTYDDHSDFAHFRNIYSCYP